MGAPLNPDVVLDSFFTHEFASDKKYLILIFLTVNLKNSENRDFVYLSDCEKKSKKGMKTENTYKPIIKARGTHAKEKRWDSKTELMGKERVKKDREERENLVLWKAPVGTISNFVAE